MWELDKREHPQTYRDCAKEDMMSFGLSQEDAQVMDPWRKRIKEQPANPSLPGNGH